MKKLLCLILLLLPSVLHAQTVTLLDAWTVDGTYDTSQEDANFPVSVGTDRIVIVCLSGERNGGGPMTVTSVTLGNQALTELYDFTVGSSIGYHDLHYVGYLLEAGIAAMDGDSLRVNYGVPPTIPFDSAKIHYASYQYIDQTTPIIDSDSNSNTSATTLQLASTITAGTDDKIIGFNVLGQHYSPGLSTSGYTEETESIGATNGHASATYHRTATTSVTENPTFTSSTATRMAVSAMVLNASVRPTVSSAANQTFCVSGAATAISTITVIDVATPAITAANDIRIQVPTGFNMIWDTLDLTATIAGGASSKVSGTVSYEDAGKTLVLDVTASFAASDTVSVSALSFMDFTAVSAADNLELITGGAGGVTDNADDKTIAVTSPSISSAVNQTFTVNDAATAMSTITVADTSVPCITAANDLRIRIPAGFNMIWDTLDGTATIGGNASGKVSGTVSYEDAGKTLVLDVTTSFAASDTITVAALSFISFTASSMADNLELVVSGAGGGTAAIDDKTIAIVEPTLSSTANQTFTVGNAPTAISTQTVVDDGSTPSISAATDIRIRIPSGFNMIWDTLDLTATIGGNASSKVSGTVSYEDAGKTLVLNVTTNFLVSDTITVAALSFTDFTAGSSSNNLELEVNNDGAVSDLDDKTITILAPALSSAANQTFALNASPTAISTQTVIDDSGQPTITAANDIRIRIPTGFNMIWDTLDLTATTGGNASSKVSGTVSYEDAGKTLVLDVTANFAASDTVTVAALSFTGFIASSAADNLELVVSGAGGGTAATDDKSITILAPTFSSAANQTFTVGDALTAISTQTVIDASSTPTISAANDIRIRIPTGFNMIWDTLDLTATIGGNASGKVSGTVSYEDAGKTLVLDVTTSFAASDTITVADLSFTEFTATSPADSLELEVNNDGVVSNLGDKTITIVQPTLSSTANQTFTLGDAPTAISTQTVIDAGSTPTITAANDIRIRIPTGFNMIWDTLDLTATIGGNASGKVSGTVSYQDAGKTLVLDVTTSFAASDTITVADLSFVGFRAGSPSDNLEVVVSGAGGGTAATDDKTITIQKPRFGYATGGGTFYMQQVDNKQGSKFTLAEGASVDSIHFYGKTGGGAPDPKVAKAIIYQDNAGSPGAWVATTVEVTITSTLQWWSAGFSSPVSLTAGTYWLVLHHGTRIDIYGDAGAANQRAYNADTYSDGPADPFGAATQDAVKLSMYATYTPMAATISSAANQAFAVGDPATAISTITVIDTGFASINAMDEIRIRIPTGLNMLWDTLDVTATIGGPASSKVSGTVSYEDAGKTLVLDVTSDFVVDDTITVASLSFSDFSATSTADNLELIITGSGDSAIAYDDKTKTIGAATISSATDQTFCLNGTTTAVSTQTVVDDILAPRITSANDIRIQIPTGFNMIWDTLDLAATIGGGASTKVSATVSYEDNGQTLVLDVTSDFAANDTVTVSDLSFMDFTALSAADNLELITGGASGVTVDTDDKLITITVPTISSAANQSLVERSAATAISNITIADTSNPCITATGDLRIRIPSGFNMIWDTLDVTATIGGNASGKVSGTVSYEDAGKTLVANVTTNFSAYDTVTVADLSFMSFTATSPVDNLELEVNNNGLVSSTDDKTITIVAPIPPSAEVDASSSTFTVSGQTITWSHTVGAAGKDRLLVVGVGYDGRTGETITTVTHAGNNLTFIRKDYNSAQPRYISELWYILAPDTGSNNVVVTFSSTPQKPRIGGAVSFTGVNQTTPVNNDDGTWGTSSSASLSITSAVGDIVMDNIVSYKGTAPVVGAGQTQRWNTGVSATKMGAGSTEPGAATVTMSWSNLVANGWGFSATNVVAALPNFISSAADQTFCLSGAATAISTITVVDSASPAISAINDIRIQIPAGFNMIWDTLDLSATIGGGASSKVSNTVSYEDNGKTLVLDVTSDFATMDTLTVSALSFTDFTAVSASDNLELITGGAGGPTADTDLRRITITVPTITSAAAQAFVAGDAVTPISTITVTDTSHACITAANDIRIRIPAGFNMIWDTLDLAATIAGNASGKVSGTVSYEDNGATLVLAVSSDFAGFDTVTVADLGFRNFIVSSPADNLELEVNNDGAAVNTDDKSITITEAPLTMTSATNQIFYVGWLPTQMQQITVVSGSGPNFITAAVGSGDIRIRIPAGFAMLWDTTVTTVTIGGGASAKVLTTVTYEDVGKTLVLDVTSDFLAQETITIDTLYFSDFTASSANDNLEIEIDNDDAVSATDAQTIRIMGAPILSSASNQTFSIGNPSTTTAVITVAESSADVNITSATNIRIHIPTGFSMIWDTTVTSVTIGGPQASNVSGTLLAYEDGGRTLVLNVTTTFAVNDTVTITGAKFNDFTAASAADSLELEVDDDGVIASWDDKWILIDQLGVAVINAVFAFGTQLANTWLVAESTMVINTGEVTENFLARISQFTDGSNNWALSNVVNGADSIRSQWSISSNSGPWTDITAYAADFTIDTNLAVNDTISLWFRIQSPISTSSFNEHSSTITVTAEAY